MKNLTRLVLRKPITVTLIVISLIFFGIMSLLSAKLEVTPSITMPMYVVVTIYPGAAPEDVDKLIVKPIEKEVMNLNGVKEVDSIARENFGVVVAQYEYSVNKDQAYSDLKKKIDSLVNDLPDGISDAPSIMEMDVNEVPSMRIIVDKQGTDDIYNFIQNSIQPKLERLSDVSSVNIMGGTSNYVRIELVPSEIEKYGLTMSTVAQIISAADFTIPAGTVKLGTQELSVSAQVKYDTVESLKSIPIITGNKNTIYLEDIANIYTTKDDNAAISRYNGNDAYIIGIIKNQSADAVKMSNNVIKTLNDITKDDPTVNFKIVEDKKDNILNSIKSVIQTLVIAIFLSMFIIYLFFGNIKASLIVGTSIPISLLAAIILMRLSDFTFNVLTLSGLVMGVGMMVDNSIVVLESCFRVSEDIHNHDLKSYIKASLMGSDIVAESIFGSTLTTCVVFAPLGMMSGLAAQFFRPIGFTIIYCMLASLVSALTIVPFCYSFFRPNESKYSPAGNLLEALKTGYQKLVPFFIKHKAKSLFLVFVLFIGSLVLASTLGSELMADVDEGKVKIDITTKPSQREEYNDIVYKKIEEIVSNDENVSEYVLSSSSASNYSMSSSSGSNTLLAFLKDGRPLSTDEVIKKWKKEMSYIPDCNLTIESYNTTMSQNMQAPSSGEVQIILASTNYDELKVTSDRLVNELINDKELIGVHSSLENFAPLIKIKVDSILAASEGFTPKLVGAEIYNALSGVVNARDDITVNGQDLSVKLEYPKNEYGTINNIENLTLKNSAGGRVRIKDIASVSFDDSPAAIIKVDKEYRATIRANFSDSATTHTKNRIMKEVVPKYLTSDISLAKSNMDTMMGEEFGKLYFAIAIAIFLVFIVMALQFESAKFSLMVMITIPMSFIGSFAVLWLTNSKLSMVALLGFLMLVGTVVNNGILYIDTVNQYKLDMPLDEALIQAGSTRLRPILMTTLTTIIAMVPMALAYGKNGEIMKPLGLVDIGGLAISTLMALFILPGFYKLMYKEGSIYDELKEQTPKISRQIDAEYLQKEMLRDSMAES